jgi:hypothetical protein
MTSIEIAGFRKRNGALSKKIWLGKDGNVKSDGSACKMVEGEAYRVVLNGVSIRWSRIESIASPQENVVSMHG